MAFTIIMIAPPPSELFEWFHYQDELNLEAFGLDHFGRYKIDKSLWQKVEEKDLQKLPEYGKLLRRLSDHEYYRLDGDLIFENSGFRKSDHLP